MAIPTDYTVFLKLDEASGTRADDSGNGYNATEVGGTINDGIGVIDGCAQFIAADENQLSVPGNADTRLDDSFTICFWLNMSFTDTNQGIMNKDTFSLNVSFGAGGFGNISFQFMLAGGADTNTLTSTSLAEGWNFVALGVDRTGDTAFIRINNEERTSEELLGAPSSSDDPLLIGNSLFSGYGSFKMDQFRFYHRALSDSELLDLYNEATAEPVVYDIAYGGIGDSLYASVPAPNIPNYIGSVLTNWGINATGPRLVYTKAMGIPGSYTTNWLPIGATGSVDQGLIEEMVEDLLASGAPIKIVTLFLGRNENNGGVHLKALVKSNTLVIGQYLYDNGIDVVLCCSTYVTTDDVEGTTIGARMRDYNEAYLELSQEHPEIFVAYEDQAYDYTKNFDVLPDGLHLNEVATRAVGAMQAKKVYDYLYPSSGPSEEFTITIQANAS